MSAIVAVCRCTGLLLLPIITPSYQVLLWIGRRGGAVLANAVQLLPCVRQCPCGRSTHVRAGC
jgi:hypothetical protein